MSLSFRHIKLPEKRLTYPQHIDFCFWNQLSFKDLVAIGGHFSLAQARSPRLVLVRYCLHFRATAELTRQRLRAGKPPDSLKEGPLSTEVVCAFGTDRDRQTSA